MLDIVFIALLLFGFITIKCFADWCEKQVDKKL